jgi:membrane protein DedA with SNARE-associated domain
MLSGMKPVWLVAALALAAFLVWRRRRLERPLLVVGAIAVLGMAVYSTGVIELPNLDKLLEDVGGALGRWTYLLAGGLIFLEDAAFLGLVIPGETALIVAGVVAGQGEIDIVVLIAVVWACAVAGDLTGYVLGRRLGRPFLVRNGSRFGMGEDRIHQVEGFFEKHGGKAIFIGRFVGLVRAMAPFLAGSSRMPLRRFVPYDVLGAGIQTSILCLVGFIFWHSLDRVLAIAKQSALALSATLVLVVAIVAAVRWLRVPEHRERVLALPGARRLQGPVVFVWERLTPGNLGLELTTLLATALVGGYVFLGYLLVLDGDELTPGDRRAGIWGEAVRMGWLDDVADAAGHLGSLPVVAVALVLVAAGLFVVRERLEALVLVGGLALTIVAAVLADGAITRDAPVPGASAATYPDVHAAYAVTWIALAVALRRAAGPLTRSAALAVVGTVLTVAYALGTVYLREDWFSDVAGGVGLGVLCFSLAGVAGLLVNARSGEAAPD